MVQYIASSQTSTRFQIELETLNFKFNNANPIDILAWCADNIATGLAQTTSFSILAVTHMLYRELQLTRPVPVIFLDTLHHFPETLETVKQAANFYNLDLRTYHVKEVNTKQDFAARYGANLWETDVARFHYLTKVEPLQRALDEIGVEAWITGRRRDQSLTRQYLPIFERDRQGRIKVNPLANWTRKELWRYVYQNNVLYNPLHDHGYTSIGDQPLTTPVFPGENERAGRWRGSEKSECGIHV